MCVLGPKVATVRVLGAQISLGGAAGCCLCVRGPCVAVMCVLGAEIGCRRGEGQCILQEKQPSISDFGLFVIQTS